MLSHLYPPGDNTVYDLVIVGGGTVGSLIARQLAKSNIKVCVLEVGGLNYDSSLTLDQFEVNQTGAQIYRGCIDGRAFCLGGTSTIWGGALIPFRGIDFASSKKFDIGRWPFDEKKLNSYIPTLESFFSIDHSPYESDGLLQPSRTAEFSLFSRSPKWPLFKKRNVFNIAKDIIARSKNLFLYFHCEVIDYDIADECIRCVTILNSGRKHRINGKNFILCNGAIESTRHLLYIDSINGGGIKNDYPFVGEFLSDHISSQIARIKNLPKRICEELTEFKLCGRTMRNTRYEYLNLNNVDSQAAGFLHFTPPPNHQSVVFSRLRRINQALQCNKSVPLNEWLGIARDLIPFMKFVWHYARYRCISNGADEVDIHLVCENTPRRHNRINLLPMSESEQGRINKIELNWELSKTDINAYISQAKSSLKHVENLITGISNENVQFLRVTDEDIEKQLCDGGGIFHPVGTLRASECSKTGVVNPSYGVHKISNLSIISSAILPTAGSANPTMLLLLMGLHYADMLRNRLCSNS